MAAVTEEEGAGVLVMAAESAVVEWVVGVEGVERAIAELKEETLTDLEKVGPKLWKTNDGGITVIMDDFFEADVGQCDAIYDRAAMVAIPPSAREAYVAKHFSILQTGGKILLVTLDAGGETGPPFTVDLNEVQRLFPAAQWDVRVLSEHTTALRGATVSEFAHLITKK